MHVLVIPNPLRTVNPLKNRLIRSFHCPFQSVTFGFLNRIFENIKKSILMCNSNQNDGLEL